MRHLILVIILALITSSKTFAQNLVNMPLIIAVAQVETNFNPKAIGTKGERGMWQIYPKMHPQIAVNAPINVQMRYVDAYLTQLRRTCYPILKEAWIVCYNYGPAKAKKLAFPKKTAYYRKIQEALKNNGINIHSFRRLVSN